MNSAFLSTDATRSLFRLFYYFLPYVAYQPQVTNHFNTEYDYVIAGGGSAGSVLASRLSEDPCVKVLLLEAGGSVDPNTEIPIIGHLNQFTKNDWQFPSTTTRKEATGYHTQEIISVGKGLGGSSLLNYMLYARGNKRDFDQWAENGCTGWTWDDVYPYFLKAENNTDPDISQNGYHSTSGPLSVGTPSDDNAINEAFAAAGPELGYEYRDINAAKQTGFQKIQGFLRNGRRCSTAKAYLIPAQNRDNLDIVREAYVQKVLINDNKEAYGVRFEKDGKVHDVRGRKEIIVSSGAFQSPKILMLSGIGPKQHLESFGIKVIADLPVGKNLQNHVGNDVLSLSADPARSTVSEIELVKAALRYKRNATGPFTGLAGIQGNAFINSKNNDPEMDWPDLQIYLNAKPPKIYEPGFQKKDKDNDNEDNSLAFFPNYLRPKSRGTVQLKSTDPYDYPEIDFNMFDNEEDFKIVVDAMKQCLDIVKTTAFQKIGAKLATKPVSGCEQYEIYSDNYLECAARRHAKNAYHPASTCKMGDADDETTVVDPQLKVKRIKNLRVVDGSIMPTIVSGNLNGPITMIAEKAADMIKMDNADRKKCSMER